MRCSFLPLQFCENEAEFWGYMAMPIEGKAAIRTMSDMPADVGARFGGRVSGCCARKAGKSGRLRL